jgi:Conserved TM helix
MLEQIRNHFATGIGQIIAYLPNLVSAIIVLLVGYLVSRVLGSVVAKLLGRARFDGFVARHLHPPAGGTGLSASRTAGMAVFWLGMLVTFSLAAQALRLAALSAGINRIIGYVPRVIVAALIVAIAVPVARVLSGLVANVSSPSLAKGVRVAVIALSVFMALDELGVARNIVIAGFIAVVASAAAAAAIAFGVGGIDIARDYARQWRGRSAWSRMAENASDEFPTEPRVTTSPRTYSPESPEPSDRSH